MTVRTLSFLVRCSRLFRIALLVGFSLYGVVGSGTLSGQTSVNGASPLLIPLLASAQTQALERLAQGTVEPSGRGVTRQSGRSGVTEQPGRVGVTESPSPQGAVTPPTPSKGRAGQTKPIIVKALLNGQLTVPLVLDTGATYTVLTKHTAQALGLQGLDRLPKHAFLTASGEAHFPIITLQSIQVEAEEVQEVGVAVDVSGRLPIGLLGMTFLHHFKVTVDQRHDQVTFERR